MNLIFDEGPIARSYLMVFKENNLIDNKIFFLNISYKPLKFFNYFRFHKYNFFALKFLNNTDVKYLIDQIEEFFNFRKNFIKEVYNYKNIYDFENLIYVNNTNINNKVSFSVFENCCNDEFLNSGKKIIYKSILEKIRIFHFHPGYLPQIKGADSSIRSIQSEKKFGISFFELNKKIDEGYVLFREKKDYPNLKLKNKSNFSVKEMYNIWHSFIDPILRAYYLNEILKSKIHIDYQINSEKKLNQISKFELEETNYYSFLNQNEKKKFFQLYL